MDRDAWVFRRETEGIRDRRSPGTPSRTTIEDSVVDLCAEADQTQILDLVTRAVQGRRTNARRILECVDRRPRVRHRAHLHALLDDVVEGASRRSSSGTSRTWSEHMAFLGGPAKPEPSEGAPTATSVTRSTPPSSSSTARSTQTSGCAMRGATTQRCSRARSRSATAGRMSRSGPAGSPGRWRPSFGPEDGRTKGAAARAVRGPGTPISRTGEVS